MGTVLLLHVLISIILIVIVLLQQSKGAGLGSVFGGGGQSLFGGRGAAPFLIKTTVVLATLFMLITFSLSLITAKRRPQKTAIEREISRGVLPVEQVFTPEEKEEAPPPEPEGGE